MFHLARNNLKFFLAIIFLFLISSFFSIRHIFATGSLQSPQDIISNTTPGMEGVTHKISFILPYDSEPINFTDWVIIRMPRFSDLEAPTQISGNFAGTPEIVIDNDLKDVKITNISMLAGRALLIDGLIATNPIADIDTHYIIQIIISEDEEGNLIKNIATIFATDSKYQVDVTATIVPPVASLQISGTTAPATFVTFMENGTVIGTDTGANLTGTFLKQIFGLIPGNHNISIYGVDNSWLTTSIYNLNLFTPIYQQTTVSNLLLSPTIRIDRSQVISGTDLLVSGSTIPNGNVNIFTETPLRIYNATASANGTWSHIIDDTDNYIPGDYRVYSLVHDNLGVQSIFSNSLIFSIIPSSSFDPGDDPDCDISQADLNCDGFVNLADFSVIMYYWSTTAAAADINSDGIVDIVDFSILMYHWGA